MSVIYVLIPIAILLTLIGIYIFFWAVKTEQFEDLEKQGMSILFDESQYLKPTLINSPFIFVASDFALSNNSSRLFDIDSFFNLT